MRSAIDPPDRYRARVDRYGARTVAGYVYDTEDLPARLVVELWVDGVPIALVRADRFVGELAAAGVGDGRYGFAFVLTPEAVEGGRYAQVGLANRGHLLGPGLDLAEPAVAPAPDAGAGGVTWQGGLALAGWLRLEAGGAPPRVRCSVDGEIVAEGIADRWRHRPATGGAHPVHAFALHLPDWLADGSPRRVHVTSESGDSLRGSPVSLLALPEPLEACLVRLYGPTGGMDGERARLFDRLSPRSVPLGALEGWLGGYSLPRTAGVPVAIALVGTDPEDLRRSLDSLRTDPGLDWVAAALPSPDRIGFAPEDLAGFLRMAGSGREAVLVAPAGAVFLPGAVARLTAALTADACLAYGDIALGPAGCETPLAFPAFDYERWLEQGYGALIYSIPRRFAVDAHADSLYALACAAFGAARPRGVVHVPGLAARLGPLSLAAATHHLAAASRAHLARRGVAVQVAPGTGAILPAVRVLRRPANGTVSVIVAVRDRVDRLRRCLASLRGAIEAEAGELIVIDNGSSDPETRDYLAALSRQGARILTEPGPFNHAHLCNCAVEAARGDFALLLHDDIEAVEAGWLEELRGRAADPAVAAVGAVLRWPSGVVRHAGLVLGPGFAVRDACDDRLAGEPGYGDLLRVASEPSAVAGACLLVRRDAYRAVGGMDAVQFPVRYGAVDLCLRLGARGGAIVLTPHLHLRHNASAGRGHAPSPDQDRRFARELRALRARWGEALAADPAYSPLLALGGQPYTGLACPPRSLAPRRRALPPPRPVPAGS